MMSYTVYKIVHYLGIFLLVTALSVALARAAGGSGGSGENAGGPPAADPWKRRLAAAHGVGLFLVLLGGFGMLARLGVDHGELFPGWIWAKLGVWVALGALVVARRSPAWAARALVLVPLLAALAGAVALTKPF